MKRRVVALAFAAAVGAIGTLGTSSAYAACLVSVPILADCSGGNCAVNAGTCRGQCAVNTGYCGTYCRSLVNVGSCFVPVP